MQGVLDREKEGSLREKKKEEGRKMKDLKMRMKEG